MHISAMRPAHIACGRSGSRRSPPGGRTFSPSSTSSPRPCPSPCRAIQRCQMRCEGAGDFASSARDVASVFINMLDWTQPQFLLNQFLIS